MNMNCALVCVWVSLSVSRRSRRNASISSMKIITGATFSANEKMASIRFWVSPYLIECQYQCSNVHQNKQTRWEHEEPHILFCQVCMLSALFNTLQNAVWRNIVLTLSRHCFVRTFYSWMLTALTIWRNSLLLSQALWPPTSSHSPVVRVTRLRMAPEVNLTLLGRALASLAGEQSTLSIFWWYPPSHQYLPSLQ